MENQDEAAFKNIIGYEKVKQELTLILDLLHEPKKYQRFGAHLPNTLLLKGMPGVGKTLFAQAFLNSSGLPNFILRKDKSKDSFLEEIRATFKEAIAKAPSVILLDDFDKFSDADEGEATNAEEFVVVQTCLEECQGKGVFVIATLNEDSALPDSLLRAGRFGKTLVLDPPKGEEAEQIIAHYLQGFPLAPNLDIPLLARLLAGESCAALAEAVNEGALLAGQKNEKWISWEDLVNAALVVVHGQAENKEAIPQRYRQVTAYHEAGHALIQELLEPGSVSFVSIRKFKNEMEGFTLIRMDEDYFRDIRFMQNRVKMLLAGKAAVELANEPVDVGSNWDCNRAYEIAERFVDDYAAYGFAYRNLSSPASEILKASREDRVRAEIENAYLEDKEVLFQNKGRLENFAQRLLEKEILFPQDVQALMN